MSTAAGSARVCVFCERGKFATQVVLFSVQIVALGSANREVNVAAGALLGEI